jgi:hypothetical protein
MIRDVYPGSGSAILVVLKRTRFLLSYYLVPTPLFLNFLLSLRRPDRPSYPFLSLSSCVEVKRLSTSTGERGSGIKKDASKKAWASSKYISFLSTLNYKEKQCQLLGLCSDVKSNARIRVNSISK